MSNHTYQVRKYAWEFPVRFTHWINVLSIVTFVISGLYIGNPYLHGVASDAHVASSAATTPFHEYMMGYMRMAHFIAGYVFMCSFVFRIYWAFAGNKYASWRIWMPLTRKQFGKLMDTLKFYSFISRKSPSPIGHNALAGVAYMVVFGIFTFEIFSGFAMLSLSSSALLPTIIGGWMLSIMDLQTLRYWHHQLMYAIGIFFLIHIYIAWWLDTVEKNALLGSIFDGYKYIPEKNGD